MSRRAAPSAGQDYLPTLVVDVANAMWRAGAAFYRTRFGVGMVEVRLLLFLHRQQAPAIAAAIATSVRLDKAAVSRGLKALEAAGHVALSPDARGGRRIAVVLTTQGRRVAAGIGRSAIERQALLLDGMDDAEAALLRASLRRLLAQVDLLRARDRADAARPRP